MCLERGFLDLFLIKEFVMLLSTGLPDVIVSSEEITKQLQGIKGLKPLYFSIEMYSYLDELAAVVAKPSDDDIKLRIHLFTDISPDRASFIIADLIDKAPKGVVPYL